MASAKRKASAKRNVKYAAKAQSTATSTRSQPSAAEWVKNTTAQWQKGAEQWANQGAKMYQMPFTQQQTENAAHNATATMQSATESMMKASTEMLQQMMDQAKKAGFAPENFSQNTMFKSMPQFDASSAQEQMSKSSANATRAANEMMSLARENFQVMIDVTNIAVSVSKELGAEWVSYLNRSFAQNTELSKQALTCRTLNDLFDLGARVMKSNLDAFFTESVKMSEKLFQCATDVSEPLNERMSETTERMTKAMAA